MKKSVFPLVSFIFLVSCNKPTEESNKYLNRELFKESCILLEEYISKFQSAGDSTVLNRLSKEFDDKITEINFKFPPETDMHMTEEENDSLVKLFGRLDSIRREKNESFKTDTLIFSDPSEF